MPERPRGTHLLPALISPAVDFPLKLPMFCLPGAGEPGCAACKQKYLNQLCRQLIYQGPFRCALQECCPCYVYPRFCRKPNQPNRKHPTQPSLICTQHYMWHNTTSLYEKVFSLQEGIKLTFGHISFCMAQKFPNPLREGLASVNASIMKVPGTPSRGRPSWWLGTSKLWLL